jgi:hypothetical protein
MKYHYAAGCFFFIFILCLSLGVAIVVESSKIVTASKRYDDKTGCELASKDRTVTCEVELEVDDDMDGPVYFYVEMHNYFQNHRIYSKSRDYSQLSGEDLDKDDLTNCGDYTTLGDLYFDLGAYPVNQKDRQDDDFVMNPCGLIARSYMNDSFSFVDNSNVSFDLEADDIAWSTDGDNVYSNNDDWKELQWLDVEEGNLHTDWFKVWMRVAAFSSFKKLKYVIDDDIDAGTYQIRITSSKP